jgi:hypothetical protein
MTTLGLFGRHFNTKLCKKKAAGKRCIGLGVWYNGRVHEVLGSIPSTEKRYIYF